jgi:hypothetical protein
LIGRCGLETLPGSIFVTVADFATILFCITLESRGWLRVLVYWASSCFEVGAALFAEEAATIFPRNKW